VPRDRNGSFEPAIVPTKTRRLGNINSVVLSLYSRGMTTRDIEAHLAEVYGATVSRELISNVTEVVVDEIKAWQSRPLDEVYLRSFAERHNEVADAGITEVVFFHSPVKELRGYQSQLPFVVVADPQKEQYRQFGVEARLRALMHPRPMWTAFRGYVDLMRHRNDANSAGVGTGDGSTHLGLPADFLIDPDGTVVAAHYGRHADDQWSVDQLLDIHHPVGRDESC
jgi:peroxiredoxin